jgi:WhiB family transcriptional regulator, redox-sensing transcriptional regulator
MPRTPADGSSSLGTNWSARARCRGESLDVFFSPENENAVDRRQRDVRAKRICAQCDVLDQCRTDACNSQEAYGIWGGTVPSERKFLIGRGRRNLNPARTSAQV